MYTTITPDILFVPLPMESVGTGVFLLFAEEGKILFDSGCNDSDVRTFLLPVLQELSFSPDWLLISHWHGDHCGGIEALRKAFPNATVASANPTPPCGICLQDDRLLFSRYRVLHLPGHTPDSMAVYDEYTKTLLTADCLQQQGIGTYGTSFYDVEIYQKTIARVRAMPLQKMVATHAYSPCGQIADGVQIFAVLHACLAAIQDIVSFSKEFSQLNATELARAFQKEFPNRPPVPASAFACVKNN